MRLVEGSLFLWLAALAPGQASAPASRPATAPAEAETERRLQRWLLLLQPGAVGSRPASDGQAELRHECRTFLRAEQATARTLADRMKLRARLARLDLMDFDLDEAEAQFKGMEQELRPGSEAEFRLEAKYGLAQIAELRDRTGDARELYGALLAEPNSNRYTNYARAALQRLSARTQLVRGRAVEGLPKRQDLDGVQHDLGAGDGRVLVILFWAHNSAPARTALKACAQALKAIQSERLLVVTVALAAHREDAERVRKLDKIPWPVLCEEETWLDPLALRFGVRRLPASVLLGTERQFVAADLPPEELAAAVRQLLR